MTPIDTSIPSDHPIAKDVAMNTCRSITAPILCCLAAVHLVAADYGAEIQPPAATDDPTSVTIVMAGNVTRTGIYDPRARTITMTAGTARLSIAIDPRDVQHWYAAPVEPITATGNGAAPTTNGAADSSTPDTTKSPSGKRQDGLRERWARYLTTVYSVDPTTIAEANVAKMRAIHRRLTTPLTDATPDDKRIHDAIFQDLVTNHCPALYSNDIRLSRSAPYDTRWTNRKTAVLNDRYRAQFKTKDTVADAARNTKDIDDARTLSYELFLDWKITPIDVVNRVKAKVARIADVETTAASSKPWSYTIDKMITIDKAQIWSAIQEATPLSESKKRIPRTTHTMHAELHAIIPSGVLPNIAGTFAIRTSTGSPVLPETQKTDYTRIPITNYEYAWDDDRYMDDPGLELAEYLNGTYSVKILVNININSIPVYSTSTENRNQDVATQRKALYDPTNVYTITFTTATYGACTWQFP